MEGAFSSVPFTMTRRAPVSRQAAIKSSIVVTRRSGEDVLAFMLECLKDWSALAVRIFQQNPAVSKGEQVTTMDFDAGTVCLCSRERPLRHSTLLEDKMTSVAPLGIGEGCPDLGEA